MKQEWQSNMLNILPARHADAVAVDNQIYLIGGTIIQKGSFLGHIQTLDVFANRAQNNG